MGGCTVVISVGSPPEAPVPVPVPVVLLSAAVEAVDGGCAGGKRFTDPPEEELCMVDDDDDVAARAPPPPPPPPLSTMLWLLSLALPPLARILINEFINT